MNGPLKLGVAGENVKAWQTALAKVGQPVAIDGKFGTGTQKATVAIQEKLGLKADGIVTQALVAAFTRKYAVAVGIDWTGTVNKNTTFSTTKKAPAETLRQGSGTKAEAGFSPWIIVAVAGGVVIAIMSGKGGKRRGRKR